MIFLFKSFLVHCNINSLELTAQIWRKFERFFMKKTEVFFHKKSFKDVPNMRCSIPKNLCYSVLAIICGIIISLSFYSPTTRAANFPSSAPAYIGTGRLSFYFQDIEIRTLLQLIAKSSGLNFIISDSVKGNTTLNLKNVTWKEALNVIMKSRALTARRVGNILYISTVDEITNNESKQLQANLALSNLAPIESAIIQLRYANAKELAEFLKGQTGSLLTSRGQVAIDLRTNSLVIRDIRTNLMDIIRTIRHLDVPARQVLIEARIVTIDTSYEEQLGVKFGVSTKNAISGTLNGANQIAQGVELADIVPLTDRLNFNNAASQLASGANPGSIGMALARIGSVFLDLELSAIEAEGHGQVISSPHVITSNQQKATIQTGEEIPYQEATSSGATSIAFKKAVLSLEIVPQITPNNKIILRLKATEDSRGPQLLISPGTTEGARAIPPILGPPVINSQEVESLVLLNNNETIVLGGVFKQTKQNTVDRIPFLGSLPLIGNLFKHTGINNNRRELLIFITPKIIDPFAPDKSPQLSAINIPKECVHP